MIFNSFEFALFLPIVFAIYWSLQKGKLIYRNLFLVAASYVFYGWWDYRFLSLIIISSVVDCVIGAKIHESRDPKRRKLLLGVSLASNLAILGFFKYFGFFHESFVALMSTLGVQVNEYSLRIILPVGISFYTFQTLSYTIDIYRNELEPTKDVVAFFAFVSFFPQLVAGPIERARNLLPQFCQRRSFEVEPAKDGLRQMLWGFWKKMFIADN